MLSETVLLNDLQNKSMIIKINKIEIENRMAQEINQYFILGNKYENTCNNKYKYLLLYDQLFRLVNIWLLSYNMDLTNHQPHQVLRRVSMYYCPTLPIYEIIQHRHDLKKGVGSEVNRGLFGDLQQCLNTFSTMLQKYF